MWLFTVLFVLLAIGVQMVLLVQESPVSTESFDIMENTSSYSIVDLAAPALAGLPLTIFAYFATQTPLRLFLARFLLERNGVDSVRQLAANLPSNITPLYHPVSRLSESEYQYHVEQASSRKADLLLSQGIDNYTSPNNSLYRSVMDYRNLYQSGRATPAQVLEKVLQGCTKLEHLHMFASLKPDEVRQQAKLSTERYKAGQSLSIWDGVPVAVKEEIAIQGHLVCHGSRNFCTRAENDDLLVSTLRQAGAIILGSTVMTEGGVTPLGYSLAFDGPMNPFDTEYYSGGSSGGSAVAVSTGLVPMAVGADGGGSIRIPASMTGTFGLAATFGRVSRERGSGLSVSKFGPIAAMATDTALAHVLLNQKVQSRDFYSQLYDGGVKGPPPAHVSGWEESIQGMRLGIYPEHFRHSDPEVVAACDQVVEFLERQGAKIVNITIPHLRELHLSHALKILSEFSLKWDARSHMSRLEPNTEITLALGKSLTAVEALAADKIRSWGLDLLRNEIFRDQKIDAILSPTLGLKVPKPMRGYRSTGESNTGLVYKVIRFAPLANLLGLPGMSFPVGYEKATGLPIGFQVLGDAWMEHKLLRLAAAVESGFLERRRPTKNFFDPLAEWLN